MHRLGFAALLLILTACASGPHVYADEAPKGIPKAARAHCRSYAEQLAHEAGAEGLHSQIRRCLDGMLREDCSEEMMRVAEQMEKQRQGESAFFFRFPGAWDRDVLEDEAEALKESACANIPAAAYTAALRLFHGIRHGKGGRIPWASYGAPSSGGMCRDGCPAK